MIGYAVGIHAPGKRLLFDALPAAHHLLLATAAAAIALRAGGRDQRRLREQPRADVAGRPRTPADVGATKLFDALWNGCSSSRCCSAAIPRTSRRCSRRWSATATWRRSGSRSTSTA